MANRIHHQNIWSSDLDTGRADWEHIPDILRYALRALLQSIETERLQRKTYETDLKQTIQKIETNIQSIQNNINENEQRYRKTVAELRDQKDILSKIKQYVNFCVCCFPLFFFFLLHFLCNECMYVLIFFSLLFLEMLHR